MIANASQVRIGCESPVPSRPVPSHLVGSACIVSTGSDGQRSANLATGSCPGDACEEVIR